LDKQALKLSMGRKKQRFFYGYIIAGIGFFLILIGAAVVTSYSVFFKPLAIEFGWTRAMISGAYAMCFFLGGLLGILTGRLTDRFGPRLLVTASGFLLGLGCLLMSQTNTIWQLYLFFGVMAGVSQGCRLVPIISTVSRWFIRRKGLMIGIVTSGVGGGQVIGPILASQLITNYGWRTSYIIMGLVALVAIVIAAQFLRRDPSKMGLLPYGERELNQEKGLAPEDEDLSFREAINTKRLWTLLTIYFCFGFFAVAISLHIVPHVTDLGISTVSAAAILSTIGGMSIAGRIGIGSVVDRIGGKQSLIIVFILTTAALFWLQFTKELWMFYLFALILGLAWGGSVASQAPILAESFGMRAHGAILGLVIFSVSLGGTIGPLLAGHLFDVIGNYQLIFLVFTILSLTSLILALLLKPTKKRRHC